MDDLIQTILIFIVPVVLAITWGSAAEAFVADRLGDKTPAMMGRVTWNPLKHLNVVGTVIVPVALAIISKGMLLFGWGKPVPIRYGNLRHPKRDLVWVSLASPVCNLIQMLVWGVLMTVLGSLGLSDRFFLGMCAAGILVNAAMFAFTMLPIPPLNGGRIVVGLLPPKQAMAYASLERWGLFIVLGLVFMGILTRFWLLPVIDLLRVVLGYVLLPLKMLLG